MQPPLNLLIPMAGKGERFTKAGYQTYKPFIPIVRKPMVQFVTDAFPSFVRKFVLTNRSMLTNEETRILEEDLRCEIIEIPKHNEGPAYSIYLARKSIPLNESFFISYCDIYWEWDFSAIQKCLNKDGIVFTHSGFHPHLIKNNYSAFCLPSKQNSLLLEEIREKQSFTETWMNEPLSIGVFYIKSGNQMMSSIRTLIENDTRVDGEFYPSLLFNNLVGRGQNVQLKELDFYIHWGTPEQLSDFERWRGIIKNKNDLLPKETTDYPQNVVCMAGSGSRMKVVSDQPKALIPIDGKPMFQFVMERLPSSLSLVITTEQIAANIDRETAASEFYLLKEQTQSQYDTLREAQEILTSRSDYYLTSCDVYGFFDYEKFRKFAKMKRPDAIIFTFLPSLTQRKFEKHYTYVSVDQDKVTGVHIKSKKHASDVGLASLFWIRNGKIFELIKDISPLDEKEMTIDHVFKHFVDNGLTIASFTLDQYLHLGTPEEFFEHQYWTERKHLFQL